MNNKSPSDHVSGKTRVDGKEFFRQVRYLNLSFDLPNLCLNFLRICLKVTELAHDSCFLSISSELGYRMSSLGRFWQM